jgi:hypothetical protein
MATEGVQPTPSPDATERILAFLRAEAEAKRVALCDNAEANRKTFLDTLKIAAYPLAVVLAIAGFLGIKSASDLMESIRKEAQQQSRAEIERMQGEIRATLKAQFEAPSIQAIVREAARESTATTAAPLIKNEVSRQVQVRVRAEQPQIRATVVAETKKGVDAMAPVVSEQVQQQASAAESRIRSQIAPFGDVTRAGTLSTLARNGNGEAFDQLVAMANSSSNPDVKALAVTTQNQLYLEYDQAFYSTRIFKEHKTNEQLLALLDDALPLARKAAIDGLSAAGIKSAVPKLITMMKNDPFILVREAAYHALKQLTGKDIEPLDTASWDRWWEENKVAWPK